jgi:hypothetical protein
MISGARYSGVPQRVHVRPLTRFAKPKSVIWKKKIILQHGIKQSCKIASEFDFLPLSSNEISYHLLVLNSVRNTNLNLQFDIVDLKLNGFCKNYVLGSTVQNITFQNSKSLLKDVFKSNGFSRAHNSLMYHRLELCRLQKSYNSPTTFY